MYSQNSQKLSQFMYSLLGLFPGMLTFQFTETVQVLRQMLSYSQYGFPLQLFHSKCKFVPIFSLSDLDFFDSCDGFVAGTTNQLFLSFPKAQADLVINIDKEQLIGNPKNEKSKKLKRASQHTIFEKMMLAEIVQQISLADDSKDYVRVNEMGEEELPPEDEWDQLQVIRTQFRTYLNLLFYAITQIKTCLAEFERTYSIENCIKEMAD